MKNLIISVLSAVIVSGMDFWIFRSTSDKVLTIIGVTVILFSAITAVEERIVERRRKRLRAERFGKIVSEMQNRP